MKTIKYTAMLVMVFLLALTSCKKENDFGGKAKIKGVVTLNGAAVTNAHVYIAFNAKAATTTYDASTLTDASGNYSFSALYRGDYYVTAEYTNSTGTKFTTGGAHVTIGDKKGTVDVNLTLE